MTPHVTKEQAIALKKIGFDWPVNDYYEPTGYKNFSSCLNWNEDEGCVSNPTVDKCIRWLREVKGLHVWVASYPMICDYTGKTSIEYMFQIYFEKKNGAFRKADYPTHDLAISAGITKALELCEKEGDGE